MSGDSEETKEWTSEDAKEFRECVEEHFGSLENFIKHAAMPEQETIIQVIGIINGKTCQSTQHHLNGVARRKVLSQIPIDCEGAQKLLQLNNKDFRSLSQNACTAAGANQTMSAVQLVELAEALKASHVKLAGDSSPPLAPPPPVASSNESGSATIEGLQRYPIEGLYRTDLNSFSREYLRLYSDGDVIAATLTGGPSSRDDSRFLQRFFHRPYIDSGTYQLRGSDIKFSIRSAQGTVDYQGQIEENVLTLDWLSHINGNRGRSTYHRVDVP